MTTYERVTFRKDGRSRTIYLQDPTESGVFLTGIEVDHEGDEVYGKGFDERRHIIDTGAITKRTPVVMDNIYGELVER